MQGDITTTTWTKINSPYLVTDTIRVVAGETLTIEPGVDVLFDADVPFVVEGAIYTAVTESDSVRFLKGTASEWGGMKVVGGDSSSMLYTRISDGSTSGVWPLNFGGGIAVVGPQTRLSANNVVVSHNTSNGRSGGGIYAKGAGLYLTNCSVDWNEGGSGGGLYLSDGFASIDNSPISHNVGIASGGGIYCGNADLNITRSIVAKNTLVQSGPPVFEADGEALFVGSGRVTISNCTIVYNEDKYSSGPAIEFWTGDVSIQNTIVWDNTDSPYSIVSDSAHIKYSLIKGIENSVGAGNVNLDPLFVDAESGDFRLLPGSPAIDAGDPRSPLDKDGSRADMGAFVFDPTAVGVADRGRTLHSTTKVSVAPNPFNPSTTISYSVPTTGDVTLTIYNISGQAIRTLANRSVAAGIHKVVWDGRDAAGRAVASGVYITRLVADGTVQTRRMVLIR